MRSSVSVPGSPAAAPAGRHAVDYDPARIIGALAGGAFTPNATVPGTNDPSCRSAIHPVPVVLVNGTFVNHIMSWSGMAPDLASHGYCLYTRRFGGTSLGGGLNHLRASATELEYFVDQVRSWTGAARVDLIGHSQGAVINLAYLRFNGGNSTVRRVVQLGGANNPGITTSGLRTLVDVLGAGPVVGIPCPACEEMMEGSIYKSFVPRTYPNILYTNIATRSDKIVTPSEVSFLPPASNVENLYVQNVCPGSRVGHLGLVLDLGVTEMVMNHLDPDRLVKVTCTPGFPL